MIPSVLARQLQKGIGEYIETTFPMTNEPFRGSVEKMLAQPGEVCRDPYIAVRLPFRMAEAMPTCFQAIHPEFLPYVHQKRAYDRLVGDDGSSTVIATGTGSGKTECFLYPILEYCYHHRNEPGIKALIIYPMNALASDQARRIAELIYNSEELRGNVTAGMYVGGAEHTAARMMTEHGIITDHETLLNTPPHILMTNYKMLDYLLVRPKDARLWQDNGPESLKYIAVDELHTFDGAQGTDLACLLRRLKRRLRIDDGYLCCIGTSATLGSGESTGGILEYAREVFGEYFDRDAVISEDRLTAEEYLADTDVTEFSMPTADQTAGLARLAEEDNPDDYLRLAVQSWFPDFDSDILSDEGRIELGRLLPRHSFFQAVIRLTEGRYYQATAIAEELSSHYPDLRDVPDPGIMTDSLYALISHARTGAPGKLRPFLHVQVQLWMRELRRLVAKVDPEEITYSLAYDLNTQKAKEYLPVINCRDCGFTGWISMLNERGNATMTRLETFYNLYFRADDKIAMMFPRPHDQPVKGMNPARLCPNCLQVTVGEEGNGVCPACGTRMMEIQMPSGKAMTAGPRDHKQYICPCCGSRRGLSLMGMRSATEISADLSQLFGSRFNDDKKTLAFSDNVQDAAHHAGFFNARTWRFGLRTAIQRYCRDGGAGQSLADFQDGFIRYWHRKMTDEQFAAFFIAPNMTWMHAYEEMVEKGKLGKDFPALELMRYIEHRLRYEIMLEFGLSGNMGRTLEKSGCCALAFDSWDIEEIAEVVRERTVNELGVLAEEDESVFRHMVVGWLDQMRRNGAFADPVFDEFTLKGGNTYMLSNDHNRWLPGVQYGRNTPRFPAEHIGGRSSSEFDNPSGGRYAEWIADCRTEFMTGLGNFGDISMIILEEALKRDLVVTLPSSANDKIYGLNRARIYVTDNVKMMRCSCCGAVTAVPAENAGFWEGAPCLRGSCGGTLTETEKGADFYGKLYSAGDLSRINAREHTGLLERGDREALERDFKRERDERRLWDPNVLSCTPTLEMGIDIGDLSSVILCSMPPGQSQYLQRTGRAGRKDGNALTLAVANARPHDLYFYAEPTEMIAGEVEPPKIFLKASAVLERQFMAFCMDSWVKDGVPKGAIPDHVSTILYKLDQHPADMFPFNFMRYVQSRLSRLLNTFTRMFTANPDESIRDELQAFARGDGTAESRMEIKISDAFQELKKQWSGLKGNIKELQGMIRDLEKKPKDSSFDAQIRELQQERSALLNVVRGIENKNIFNFLSDEGLLPNYAFPEAGVILRAVLYRREDETDTEKKKYQKMVCEYNRSASSAITEFAPNNHFYAGGRRLTIDQVDLNTAQQERWRLCPNCSHAEIYVAGQHTAACPKCGSPAWADAGQIRNMLKIRMVYSTMDYSTSLISDDSDDRSNIFYCRQMLVDVDEDNDITKAYRMDNEEFPFGYEFVRKATLREINFGESDMVGEKFSVSGVEEIRNGFKICKYCGKIQPAHGKPNHALACKSRKMTPAQEENAYEDCLFLYREFQTEVLRLLVPATTMDSTDVKMESFVAAFMLGMKAHFGNVDHLQCTVSDVPVPDAEYRKQYLVVYDSVPGGTGYLKQLMEDKNSLIKIFEEALSVMENCSCATGDPPKDGCYHCLFAYRQSRQIGNISRAAATRLLKAIVSGKDNIEKIHKISDIPVNPLFDSELEQMFLEAVRVRAGDGNVSDMIRGGKHGYYLKLGDTAWEIEPQVPLGPESGVGVSCKPDFIFWPDAAPDHLPVAIFTDGFQYHKDIVSDDTIKREAIRRSGKFRVWSLSYRDVQSVFGPQNDYCTETLDAEQMPSGKTMYQGTARFRGAEGISLPKLSSFDLLFEYLKRPDAEAVFAGQACACGYSLLDPKQYRDSAAFHSWKNTLDAVNGQTNFTDRDFPQSGTMFGTWVPRNVSAHFTAFAGISGDDLKAKKETAAFAVLKDEPNCRTDRYEAEWNGFWRFFNLMQFSEEFIAVSSAGLTNHDYTNLPVPQVVIPAVEAAPAPASAWDGIFALLYDPDAKKAAELAMRSGVPAPLAEDIGYEAEGDGGEVIAVVEIAWPDRKIGFMTEEQAADRARMEQMGWKIVMVLDAADTDLAALFGGNK